MTASLSSRHTTKNTLFFAAVLTGDLIGSTTAGTDAVDGAMQTIEAVATTERTTSGTDVRFARFRGDGWQIYAQDGRTVFRLTVLVLALLRQHPHLAQTRLAAATGQVAFLPPTGLASATGEAFGLSGHGLDKMTTQRLVFDSAHADARWQQPLFAYLEWQSQRWSPEQAEAVALAFRHSPPQPHRLAADLGISRQAATSRLNGAGFRPLAHAARAFAAEAGIADAGVADAGVADTEVSDD